MRKRLVCFAAMILLLLRHHALAQVTFELRADMLTTVPAAVCVTGPFNAWSTEATPMGFDGAVWRTAANLPDGRHFYKFKLRDAAGAWQPMPDPCNPFKALRANRDWCSFVDVFGGRRVELLSGLEKFEWPPQGLGLTFIEDGRSVHWSRSIPFGPHGTPLENSPVSYTLPSRAVPGAVFVKGDFGEGIFSRFPLALCADGSWRAYVPLQRPLNYRIYVDDKPYADPGNDFEFAFFVPRGRLDQVMQTRRSQPTRVRADNGMYLSYRAQIAVTSPALSVVRETVATGDARILAKVTSYSLAGDYGMAVALARKIREVNSTAAGPASPLARRALFAEAKIHKRWAKFDEAARCWQAVLASAEETSETRQAALDLSAYHAFVTRRPDAMQPICEWALPRLTTSAEAREVVAQYLTACIQARRTTESLAMADRALAALAGADPGNPVNRSMVGRLWRHKGFALAMQLRWDEAEAALRDSLVENARPDSNIAREVAVMLDFLERRKTDPNARPRPLR